VYVGTYLEKK